MTRPPTSVGVGRVLLLDSASAGHFRGVAEALAARGVVADALTPYDPPARDLAGYGCVATSTVLSPHALDALRRCRHAGVPTVLLMDGVVEWRNTFVNPRSGPSFLRPAPVSVVACAGERDRAILESLGNRAIATGLPRLTGAAAHGPAAGGPLLVATARRPWFTNDERERLLRALARVRSEAQERGLAVRWRLNGELAAALDVEPDESPLADSLARCAATLTTPSTIAVESMLSGRPSAILHPFDAPLWPLAPAVAYEEGDIGETIDALLCAGPDFLERQRCTLARVTADPAQAADRLADLIFDVGRVRLDSARAPLARVERSVSARAPRSADRLVVCVEIAGDASSVEARCAATLLADHPERDIRVLLIATSPHSPFDAGAELAVRGAGLLLADPRVRLCVVDPTRPPFRGAAIVRESLRSMGATSVGLWETPFARAGAVDWPRVDLRASAPTGGPDVESAALDRALSAAFDLGARRIAVFPAGRRAHRCVQVLESFGASTGARIELIDDSALPEDASSNPPIITLCEAASRPPDAVILCADGNAKPWADRCKCLSDAGVLVLSACDDAINPELAHA